MSRMMEQLESRRLMSATVTAHESADGVLHIVATGGMDDIEVTQASRGAFVAVTTAAGTVFVGDGTVPDPCNPGHFIPGEYANVRLIVIDADSCASGPGYNISSSTYVSSVINTGAGDDSILVNDLSDCGSIVNSNAGADTIIVTHTDLNLLADVGFNGVEILNGGAGNDIIAVVGAGTSVINGGAGDDQIAIQGVTGFTAYAYIDAGNGDDFIAVSGTADRLAYAFVNGGRGVDTLSTLYAKVIAVNVETRV